MLQKIIDPVAKTGSISRVAFSLPVDDILAAHAIEPELRTAIPRPVSTRHKPVSGIIWVALIVVAVAVALCGILWCPPVLLFVLQFIYAVATYQLCSYFLRQSHIRSLQVGIAKPAVVTNIDDSFGARITFTYEATPGMQKSQSIRLPQSQFDASGLRKGQSFTLLVDPNDDRKMIPYCAVHTSDIRGPERNIATAKRNSAMSHSMIAADLGVEAELYCAAPRCVLWTRQTNHIRILLANIVVGLGLGIFFLLKNSSVEPIYLIIPSFIGAGVIGFILADEARLWKARFYLRLGYAVRATVEKYSVDGEIGLLSIRFQYPRSPQEIGHGMLDLSLHQAAQLGITQVGANFTVLRHPDESYSYMPYFEIRGVEATGGQSNAPAP